MSYSTGTTALDPDRRDIGGPAPIRPTRMAGPTFRVLPWSGPRGWKHRPPVLWAKRDPGVESTDEGFSMVELMVVLLVLSILLAIAIPTFLGTTATADDRSAQANLSTAFTDAKIQFQNNGQTYDVGGISDPAGLSTALNSAQLSLAFKAGSSGTLTNQGSSGVLSSISVGVSLDGNGLVMGAYSVPGNCFYVVDNTQTLSPGSIGVAPYLGTYPVTPAWTSPLTAGSIGLPTIVGTSYVEVKGDVTKTDCNANTPRTSGSPATVKYLTTGFPG